MRRRFRPPLWAWAAYVPLMALLLSLSAWQLQRGLVKQRLADEEARPPETVEWQPTLATGISPPVRARLEGRYHPGIWLLLDNQSHARKPGHHLIGFVETEEGYWLAVNRGWVPLVRERNHLPPYQMPEGWVQLEGLWRPLPTAGLRALSECPEKPSAPALVHYPDRAMLACLTGLPVADGLLYLDPDPADPLGVRDWSLVRAIPASRHFGYAAQWAVFALVLSTFFVLLNLRASSDE